MKTSELFKKEIGFIVNPTIRQIVIETLDKSPECLQTIPASSTGKYHPSYALGNGGLVRHIKAAVGIADTMTQTEIFDNLVSSNLTMMKDAAYAALILHDCEKPDDTEKHNTRFNHPLLAAKLFKETAKKYIDEDNMEYMKEIIPIIYNCIASHMGQWNTAPYAKGTVLPKPKTGIETFVHMCDYLASRKVLDFNFEVYNDKT